jgi:hypothetical protein
MKQTQLWPGVTVVNRSGIPIVTQWNTLPDGTRMAMIMGDGPSNIQGTELGFLGGLISSVAPAVFSLAKSVAPGLVKKGVELASSVLPSGITNVLKSAVGLPAQEAQKAVAAVTPAAAAAGALPAATPKVMPAGLAQALLSQGRPAKQVRHLATGARIPEGYTKVMPVMRIDQGAFLDGSGDYEDDYEDDMNEY